MQTQPSTPQSNHWYRFETCGDLQLESMVSAANGFWYDISHQKPARWLSIIGTSGTGKTYLADMIYAQAKRSPSLRYHDRLINPVQRVFWPKLLSQLRSGEYWRAEDLGLCNFVFLDEVSAEHDPSGFARDKLCEILSCRVGKWTIITSNLTLAKLADIDTRISSRMIRGGSVVVQVDIVDYALRRRTAQPTV